MANETKNDLVLTIDAVGKWFGNVKALDAISLNLHKGEIACLVGQSGCGKSTLLRSIAGVEDISAGQILLKGKRVSSAGGTTPPERRNVGLMFQDYALFPHMDVKRNIAFGLKGLNRQDTQRRVAQMIDRIGIVALADRYPHMLSGGEQQRVALARALAPQPDVLLMDEPFSNLDRGLRETVRLETRALLKSLGTTAIIVTHDPEEALAFGDTVILMDAGRVVETGTGEALYRTPQHAYTARFFSRINRFLGVMSDGRLSSPMGTFAAPNDSAEQMDIYIRPEAIRFAESGVPAQVLERRLLGEIDEVLLKVRDLAQPVVMRTSLRHALREGDRVHLAIAEEDVLIFPVDTKAHNRLRQVMKAAQ
ncbi:iron ABC transporter ATP-binding protein [Devosia pacifica]|uniref:Iron ABC transporter ATP-binding protein n=1 Tax=Devosia pacifica TaxID=1335967 RepID=A0A918VM37_9HYPH|nr:ABC transporter ATP-binding protein [Devosia pacifica]GHA12335.1 iron ABC transporter ATP-binding protein [Devosia pacifica]